MSTDERVPREVTDVRARYEWKKVEAPRTWRPRANGEELAGFYGGKTSRNGEYGSYDLVIVHVPARGSYLISGTRAIQLFDAANLTIGWPVRVVWRGKIAIPDSDKTMKNFDVYVAEGDPCSPEDLPLVSGVTDGAQ